MSLIRGAKGLCPCPICLIPADQLSDLETKYPLRTAEGSQAIVHDAEACQTVADAEELLKDAGLRPVQVCKI